MNRLKEPSSYAGLALIFNGISDCMTGNYQSGVPSIILGLVAVLKKENGEWIPTDKGQPFAVRHQWVKGNKSGYNYKWKKSVLNTLIN